MTSSVSEWGGTSHHVDIDGLVHYVDFGGPADAPALVFVHGLGGSHLDWSLLAPKLAGTFRVFAIDLIGFGLTRPLGRLATVWANAKLLHRFIAEIVGGPVVLVGNSMGGKISALHTAAHPDTVTGLVLVDPVLPLVRGVPANVAVAAALARFAPFPLGRWVLANGRQRRSPRQQVRRTMAVCCTDPSAVPDSLISAFIGLMEQRSGVPELDDAFLIAARSLFAANTRAAWDTLRDLRPPVLLLHGEQDRLVSVASARAAAARNPQWTVNILPRLGHIPQVEAPDVVAASILSWRR